MSALNALSNTEILQLIRKLESEIKAKSKELSLAKDNYYERKKIVNEKSLSDFIQNVESALGYKFTTRSRKKNIIIVRQIVAYLIYNNFSYLISYREIGKLFERKTGVKGQDHSTILHSIKVAGLYKETGDLLFENYYKIIEPIFKNHFFNK